MSLAKQMVPSLVAVFVFFLPALPSVLTGLSVVFCNPFFKKIRDKEKLEKNCKRREKEKKKLIVNIPRKVSYLSVPRVTKCITLCAVRWMASRLFDKLVFVCALHIDKEAYSLRETNSRTKRRKMYSKSWWISSYAIILIFPFCRLVMPLILRRHE